MKSEAKIIFLAACTIVLFATVSHAVIQGRTTELTASEEGAFACTMEAKMCPDGTYVGRIAPYCQFAACSSAGTRTGGEFTQAQ